MRGLLLDIWRLVGLCVPGRYAGIMQYVLCRAGIVWRPSRLYNTRKARKLRVRWENIRQWLIERCVEICVEC
jgi:hypothetical protein